MGSEMCIRDRLLPFANLEVAALRDEVAARHLLTSVLIGSLHPNETIPLAGAIISFFSVQKISRFDKKNMVESRRKLKVVVY